MLKKLLFGLTLVMSGISAATAADLMDWIQSSHAPGAASRQADAASLLTLEPGQNEMYPKVSLDGRVFLARSDSRKSAAVSRRLVENGDPLNNISDDALALDSFAWYGNDNVTFLSTRAGSLGLWLKAADGSGVVRRFSILNGLWSQPLALDDGSVIAVRLAKPGRVNTKVNAKQVRGDGFDNWTGRGDDAQIVRIGADGSERMLGAGINPSLSPDGQQVVFSMAAGRSRHLFIMNVDGSNLLQLTDDRSIDVQPAWSPDGKWVVFASNRADADMRHAEKGNWDIWAINSDGRNLKQLTLDQARDGAPSVTPTGLVLFHSDRKISNEDRKTHQVQGGSSGFHIWSIALPAAK